MSELEIKLRALSPERTYDNGLFLYHKVGPKDIRLFWVGIPEIISSQFDNTSVQSEKEAVKWLRPKLERFILTLEQAIR